MINYVSKKKRLFICFIVNYDHLFDTKPIRIVNKIQSNETHIK